MQPARDMAVAFDLGGGILEVRPYGHGLVNDTYLVTTESGCAILQRINPRAFPRPALLMENLRTLYDHVRTRAPGAPSGARHLRLPAVFLTRAGGDFALDGDGGFWRALGYIENAVTLETLAGPGPAGEAGSALGAFHALVSDLDPARLHVTRPHFHDTPYYLGRFTEIAARAGNAGADADLRWCRSFVEARRDRAALLEDARRRGELRARVIHGDPKLDNFLFDAQTGRATSLIDLDTVQPGLVHYDIGDCLRSCCNPAGESPKDVAEVRFDVDICRAILKGYLSEARGFLAPPDYRYLYDAIRLIPFELGLRFLTDHLERDVYFKIDRPGQNLHRAVVQFRLAECIEDNERPIRALVADLTGE
jgi:hypothetical protein